MDKISVILTVNNNPHYLYDCLRSVFSSTYRNLEVIVVHNRFDDDVPDAAQDYHSDVIFVSTKYKNQAAARNQGFRKSAGKYVAFQNVDDVIGKMRYELCIKKFEDNPDIGMIFCGTTYINEKGEFLKGVSKYPGFSSRSFLGRMYEGNRISALSATIIKASVLKKIKGFDATFNKAEDYDLYLRAGKVTKIDYIDLPLVRKRIYEHDQMNSSNEIAEEEIKALKRIDLVEIASHLSTVYDNEEEFRIAFGKVLYKIGKNKPALQQFRKAYEINMFNEEIFFHSGNCYFQIGNHHKADDAYGKCLAINPRHADCLNNLGVLFFHLGEEKRSLTELRKAEKYGRNSLELKHNLACIKDDRPRELLKLSYLGETHLQTEPIHQN